MKQLSNIFFKSAFLGMCLFSISTFGQKESKSFSEVFNVSKDVELDINTSHADIKFETWNKDKIEVQAVIELEGASKEEAAAFFKNDPVKILGNSKSVEIRTTDNASSFGRDRITSLHNIDVAMPDIQDILINIPAIPELAPLKTMPPMSVLAIEPFNYQEYKEKGEEYLKEWKKTFSKGFDKEYQKEMAKWSEEMEKAKEEWEKQREEYQKQREEYAKQRNVQREQREIQKSVREAQLEIRKAQAEARKAEMEARLAIKEAEREAKNAMIIAIEKNRTNGNYQVIDSLHSVYWSKDSIVTLDSVYFNRPNTIYFMNNGVNRKYKVKKIITIKMPKDTKINMNVRHGEVILADLAKDIKASLAYTSLLASTIEGSKTSIHASYSPLRVEHWNLGELNLDYSEDTQIALASDIILKSKSSNVIIDEVTNKANLANQFGSLKINTVDKDFKSLQVSVKNGELECTLPSTPVLVTIDANHSNVNTAKNIKLNKNSKGMGKVIYTTNNQNKDTSKEVSIHASFSDVKVN